VWRGGEREGVLYQAKGRIAAWRWTEGGVHGADSQY